MTETLIPTMGLRFTYKSFPAGEGIEQQLKILQQRFETPGGKTVWQDVPLCPDIEGKDQRSKIAP